MKKLEFNLGKLKIDAPAYGSQGNAVLGIRDSGKTYTATEIAEKLFEAGIPFTTFDPTGVWRFLRVPGAGRGYPVVVAGGKEGDLPLTVAGAPEIVRAAMKNGVSIVLDLTDQNLSKADWKRIVKSCVRVMLSENAQHGLRHVFIEEAAEFIPQRVIDGDVYAEVEKLARIGGNSRLGYTLINQRSQEVSKAVLELCENLFLHRQKGKNALDSLAKWFDLAEVVERKEIMRSLPNLPSGECWAWMGGSDEIPVRIKVPAKNSHHPDRRAMRGDVAVLAKSAVDVGSFVSSMNVSLVEIEETDKANDPKLLRAEIVRLNSLIKATPAASAAPDPGAIAAAEQRGAAAARRQASEELASKILGFGMNLQASLNRLEGDVLSELSLIRLDVTGSMAAPLAPAPAHVARPDRGMPILGKVSQPDKAAIPATARSPAPSASGDSSVSKAMQRAIDAIGWWKKIGYDPIERDRAAVVCGLSPKASTFGVYVSKLAALGLVETPKPGFVSLTKEGWARAVVPAAVDAKGLREVALTLLGNQEKRVFNFVYDLYPKAITRSQLAEKMGLSPTASTTGVYISKVNAYGLLDVSTPGQVRAADWLFPN
jgi:hypothetical protein